VSPGRSSGQAKLTQTSLRHLVVTLQKAVDQLMSEQTKSSGKLDKVIRGLDKFFNSVVEKLAEVGAEESSAE